MNFAGAIFFFSSVIFLTMFVVGLIAIIKDIAIGFELTDIMVLCLLFCVAILSFVLLYGAISCFKG